MMVTSQSKPAFSVGRSLLPLAWQHPRYHGCVGHWWLGEGGGARAFDLSVSRVDGVITGPTWTVGKHGQALLLDGTNDAVDLGAGTQWDFADTTFSISLWFQIAVSSAQYVLVNNIDFGGWGIATAGVVEAGLKDLTQTDVYYFDTTETFADSAWHHCAVVLTTNTSSGAGNNAEVYVDGRLRSGTTGGSGGVYAAPTTPESYIGRRAGASPLYFNGSVDEVRIYDRPLSGGEIVSLYTAPFLEFGWAWERIQGREELVGAPPGDSRPPWRRPYRFFRGAA